MFQAIKTIIFWALGVLTFAVIGYFILPSRYQPLDIINNIYQSNFLLWSWANFDGEHYLSIAQNGYQTIRGQSEYAFFPLFPLLIKAIGNILFADYYLASHLIVAFSLTLFIYYLLIKNPLSITNPAQLVLSILLFPGAVFLVSIYTESLFLLLTVLVFISVKEKNWVKAALFTGLATATRINGLSLVLFLAYSLYQNRVNLVKSTTYLALSMSGIFGYMLYLFVQTGNPLSFFTAQSGWGKSSLTMPWETALNYAKALTIELEYDLVHLVVFVEVIVTIYLLTLLYFVVRRRLLTPPYLLYCLFNLALPLATGSLGSMPRFGLLLFPLFIIPAHTNSSSRVILYLISAILAGCGVILFTRGYWWA